MERTCVNCIHYDVEPGEIIQYERYYIEAPDEENCIHPVTDEMDDNNYEIFMSTHLHKKNCHFFESKIIDLADERSKRNVF